MSWQVVNAKEAAKAQYLTFKRCMQCEVRRNTSQGERFGGFTIHLGDPALVLSLFSDRWGDVVSVESTRPLQDGVVYLSIRVQGSQTRSLQQHCLLSVFRTVHRPRIFFVFCEVRGVALTDFSKPVTKDGLRGLRVELTVLDASRAVSMYLVEGMKYRETGSNVLMNMILHPSRGYNADLYAKVDTWMHPHLVVHPTADGGEVCLPLKNDR